MKIIDLAIGFSKGIIPPKIKYKGVEYEYSKILKEYIKYESCENFNLYYKTLQINVEQFNDDVEVIEDIPKEEKKINRVERKARNLTNQYIKDKLNEIIDKLNGE